MILASLFAVLLAITPAVAQNKGGDKGDKGDKKKHDRSNPKPPKDDDDDRRGRNFSLGTAPAAGGGGGAVTTVQNTMGALRTGTLLTSIGRPLPPESQQVVLSALSPDGESLPLFGALTSNGNEHATKQARKLVEALRGVPDDPARLPGAVKAYNALVDASSAQFLRNPPAEFLAVQAVLTPMAQEAVVASRQP